jgi:hypothetical protein
VKLGAAHHNTSICSQSNAIKNVFHVPGISICMMSLRKNIPHCNLHLHALVCVKEQQACKNHCWLFKTVCLKLYTKKTQLHEHVSIFAGALPCIIVLKALNCFVPKEIPSHPHPPVDWKWLLTPINRPNGVS